MLSSWRVLLAAAVAVSAVPAPQNVPIASANPSACAQVSPATAAFLKASPAAGEWKDPEAFWTLNE